MEAKKLKRTVFIGLGGTGKWALLYAKKKFLEAFGEEPPLIKFLLIDTTAAHDAALDATNGLKARLEANEILHIEARGASLLPKVHDEIREWFPPKADLKANILAGAGQVRALGRLALFANANLVYENVRDLLALARDYQYERPSRERKFIYEPYTPHLTVAVVGSLAGGTGAGIFLDVAFLLRQLMKDEDQLFGYFLLPDIFANRPGTQNVEANAYAALKELDHFMSLRENLSYTFGGRRIQVEKKPFDMVCLINRQNRAGKTFNEIEHLAELLGLGLFLLSGPMGKEQADVFDNITHQLNEQQGRYYGKTAHYASFGAAELCFQPTRVAVETRKRVLIEGIEGLLSDQPRWDPVALRRAVDEKLNEGPPEPDEMVRGVPGASSPEENRDVLKRLEEKVTSVANAAEEKARKKWRERNPDLMAILAQAFRDYPLRSLIRGLEELKDYLFERQNQLKGDVSNRDASCESLLSTLKNQFLPVPVEKKGIVGFLRERPSVRSFTREDGLEVMEAAWQLGVARARVELAGELINRIEEMLQRLNTLSRRLERELETISFREGAQPPDGDGKDASPFTLTLPPPYLTDVGADQGSNRSGFRRPDLRELVDNTDKELEKFTLSEISLAEWLGQVFRQANENLKEAVKRTFRELDQLSAPAWDYLDAWVSNPNLGYRERVSILGVGGKDEAHDPTKAHEDIMNILAGNIHERSKLQKVETGDQIRVLLYRIEASIPAFALRGIETYREKYQTLSQDRSFHIHRVWEENLEDLFPLPSLQEVARIWTRARLLGIIGHENGNYKFQDTRDPNGRHICLGSSPGEAFAAFSRDFFAFKEVEGQVIKKDRTFRQEDLQRYLARAEESLKNREEVLSGDSWTERDREVFKLEKKAVEELVKELSTYNPSKAQDSFPSL